MPIEVERNITKDAMLCDGTPRREKGFRAYVTIDMECRAPKLPPPPYGPTLRRVYVSPLLPDGASAEAWLPSVEGLA